MQPLNGDPPPDGMLALPSTCLCLAHFEGSKKMLLFLNWEAGTWEKWPWLTSSWSGKIPLIEQV